MAISWLTQFAKFHRTSHPVEHTELGSITSPPTHRRRESWKLNFKSNPTQLRPSTAAPFTSAATFLCNRRKQTHKSQPLSQSVSQSSSFIPAVTFPTFADSLPSLKRIVDRKLRLTHFKLNKHKIKSPEQFAPVGRYALEIKTPKLRGDIKNRHREQLRSQFHRVTARRRWHCRWNRGFCFHSISFQSFFPHSGRWKVRSLSFELLLRMRTL